MSEVLACEHCEGAIPPASDKCPHCGLPGLFPNVRAAAEEPEVSALKVRYEQVLSRASSDELREALDRFETQVANSKLVVSRPMIEIKNLAESEERGATNHYQLVRSGMQLPGADKWERLRRVAGAALFPAYEDSIAFGALSLDGSGLPHYGPCTVALKESHVAHRASVFERNSITFISQHEIAMTDPIPPGYRAVWTDRGRLAVAKLGPNVAVGMDSADFQKLLMNPSDAPEDDEFVEVHIYGGFTINAIESVTVLHQRGGAGRMMARSLGELLDRRGIRVDMQ